MQLHETEAGLAWVDQFDIPDQADAMCLLKAVRWVSSAELTSSLRTNIEAEAVKINGPVALFIERELRPPGGKLQRFYKQSPTKPRRAHGSALQPIESIRAYDQEVGSEGIVGALVTSIVRAKPSKFLLHPTAEDIRKKNVRAFFIITDTIGTGRQTCEFLTSLWLTASIKSWFSTKLVTCRVIAFASTIVGEKLLTSHPMKPKVIWSLRCPTISNTFNSLDAGRILSLCLKYNPTNGKWAAGFGGEGVLIAYAHGIPNNAPAIFFKKSRTWKPLFPGRALGAIADSLPVGFHEVDAVLKLTKIGNSRIASSRWLEHFDTDAKNLVLIMASLSRPPRSESAVSARTGLKLQEVRRLLQSAIHYGWVSRAHRLTDDGMKQLQHLRARVQKMMSKVQHKPTDLPYYPKSLRAPD